MCVYIYRTWSFVKGHALFTHVLYNLLNVIVNIHTLFRIHTRLLDVQKKQTAETSQKYFLTALFILYCL